MTEIITIFGTYTKSLPHVDAKSEGIYVYKLNTETGALTHQLTTTGIDNPAFLTIAPSQQFLYSVNREGGDTGGVSAFSLDPATGAMVFINEQVRTNGGPCHVMVDATERYLYAANYGEGSVEVWPIEDDGSLGSASDFHQHEGSSVNKARQEAAHAHSINLDPGNRFAYVPDLGMDKVMIYNLDLDKGKLIPNEQPFIETTPGAGPRHLDFHPNGKVLYVINELGNTVTAYNFDAESGHLSDFQTVPTLPADWDGENTTADIHVHLNGKFVYGSNRGHDSIAVYAVDEATGKLTAQGHVSTQGKTPRNFGIDPTGKVLIVANQDTSNAATYFIDQQTGALTPTGVVVDVPTSVCIKMIG